MGHAPSTRIVVVSCDAAQQEGTQKALGEGRKQDDEDEDEYDSEAMVMTKMASTQSSRSVRSTSSVASLGAKLKRSVSSFRAESLRESLLNRVGNLSGASDRRHIKKVSNVSQHLQLGEDIFPPAHQGIDVKNAIHLSGSKAPVIVKVRSKKESFCSKEDERDWRLSTEVLMNMPHSTSIVRFIEVLEDAHNYYVVMEKVSGMDLFETLDIYGNPPMDTCKEVIRELISAVADLHMRGCIHKDLKLENVMVDCSKSLKGKGRSGHVPGEGDEGPVVKLIDFDTMESVEPSKPSSPGRRRLRLGSNHSSGSKGSKGSKGSAVSTSVVGTNQYIAQEAYAGIYSPASDVFAVGVVAYRLLTGKFPFNPKIFDDQEGDNWVGSPKMNEIRERLQHEEVDFSRKCFEREPLAKDLLQRMLAADQGKRPTAAEARMHPWLARPVLSRLSTKDTGGSFPSSLCPDSPVYNERQDLGFMIDPASSVESPRSVKERSPQEEVKAAAPASITKDFVVPPDAPPGVLNC